MVLCWPSSTQNHGRLAFILLVVRDFSGFTFSVITDRKVGPSYCDVLRKRKQHVFTARRNASVRLSVRPSVKRRYCVKTTARSTVQFALSDSKMCLVL